MKIALLLPMAGFDQVASTAKAMKQAAEMALFEQNNANIQLLVKDDLGTPEGAAAAADQAIREGAEVILGPLLSRSVQGAQSVARGANVPVIAFSNDTSVAGNGTYLMSFLAGEETERIVSFASSRGKKRFAALIPDDAYGHSVEPAFRLAVAKAGGSLSEVVFFPTADSKVLPDVVKRFSLALKAELQSGQRIDAVFVPAGADLLRQVGPHLAYAGFGGGKPGREFQTTNLASIKVLGTGAWDFASIGNDAAYVGGWYPGTDPGGMRLFSEQFVKTFGVQPPRIASLSYDAVNVAASIAGEGPAGQRFTTANLTRSNGFSGVDGVFRFETDGLTSRNLAVLEVGNYLADVIDPAPLTLGSAKVSAVEPLSVGPMPAAPAAQQPIAAR